MTVLLALDTATPATVVGVQVAGGALVEQRDDPPAGERPRHTGVLLALCERALAEAGAQWGDVRRIGAGLGPGTFTGLRIGIATARALAHATGADTVGVSTLAALAAGAGAGERHVLAVLDARRGEAFVAAHSAGAPAPAAAAVAPGALAALGGPGWLAVGDGAIRYREALELGGIEVPPDADPRHRLAAGPLLALAAAATPVPAATLTPDYVRLADAEVNQRRAAAGS